MKNAAQFSELMAFAQFKARPGIYFGRKSLLSLRDHLHGMQYAFSFCCGEDPLEYFRSFVDWYHGTVIDHHSGYACWWNHILYTSGNFDDQAFDTFFRLFEKYLREIHGISLPDPE